jgi:hypothetical protein
MSDPSALICSTCKTPALTSANFCSNCGKPLRKKPPSTTLSMQLIVYLVSFFLAPVGLLYAWKYLKQNDRESKIVGMVAIALTAIAVVIFFWTLKAMISIFNQTLRSLDGLGW